MPICANDTAGSASITTANNNEPNNSERMEGMAILFPLAHHPSFARCCFAATGCADSEAKSSAYNVNVQA
jgi:hypothetical protein